jgi:hypothetical protein
MDITTQLGEAIAWGAGLVLGVAGVVFLIFWAVSGIAGLYRHTSST